MSKRRGGSRNMASIVYRPQSGAARFSDCCCNSTTSSSMCFLLAASVVTAFLGHWVDTGVILAVVAINAAIGFIQEGKAEQAMDAVRKMLSLQATVIRGERRLVVGAETLVPGDIVFLQSRGQSSRGSAPRSSKDAANPGMPR